MTPSVARRGEALAVLPGGKSLEARLRDADTDGFPALNGLEEREQILWVLAIAKERLGVVWVRASEVATALRDVYGIHISRQRVQTILASDRREVAVNRKGGLRSYQIMQAGLDGLLSKGPDVVFIEPSKALSGLRSAQALMASFVGTLRFCDPYVASASLDLLADATTATEIRLLTTSISKPDVFARDLAAFRKEHGPKIEVRQAAPGTLHDRYGIDDGRMLLFGTSLNGLGKKQSFIVELGEDMRATATTAFDKEWNTAKPL
jgi:hypothetical protein